MAGSAMLGYHARWRRNAWISHPMVARWLDIMPDGWHDAWISCLMAGLMLGYHAQWWQDALISRLMRRDALMLRPMAGTML